MVVLEKSSRNFFPFLQLKMAKSSIAIKSKSPAELSRLLVAGAEGGPTQCVSMLK